MSCSGQWGGFQKSERSKEKTPPRICCQLVWNLGEWFRNGHCTVLSSQVRRLIAKLLESKYLAFILERIKMHVTQH